MSQEAIPGYVPVEFTLRPWNPHAESWDDFMGAVERGYAQYLDGRHRTITAEPTGQDPKPTALNSDGESL
jgi:hypothetical protein